MGLVGLERVIFFDLFTFLTAFLVPALLIRIPGDETNGSTVSDAAWRRLLWLDFDSAYEW